jgi:hypothetical protein
MIVNITMPAGGSASGLQFTFTNAPTADFTVLTATNLSLALTNWTVLGEVRQVGPGRYQFTDSKAATTVSWASNATVVVEASTNLAVLDWQPLQTNTIVATNGFFFFSDANWTNYPGRFYRVIAQ